MKFRIRQNSDGSWSGVLTFATYPSGGSSGVGDVMGADASISVAAVGADPASAVMNAAAMADRIASDPMIRALMPPQVQAAIMATKLSAAATKKGLKAVKGLFGRLRGKKKKKMLHTMHRAQTRANREGGGGGGINVPRALPDADNSYEEEEPAPTPPDRMIEREAYADIMDPEPSEAIDPADENDVEVDMYDDDGGDDDDGEEGDEDDDA